MSFRLRMSGSLSQRRLLAAGDHAAVVPARVGERLLLASLVVVVLLVVIVIDARS